MADRPDRIDRIDLCSDCGGLRATTATRLPGVHTVTINTDRGTRFIGPATVYVSPLPEPCTATREEADRG